MNDLTAWIMVRARDMYGDKQLFNAANFSHAWKEITGLKSGLDGRAVAAMLHGRTDVEAMPGGSYYKVRKAGQGAAERGQEAA